jgi:hypothetical protein
MLQRDEDLPELSPTPAPWSLRGHGWIVLLHLPARDEARTAFVPTELRRSLRAPVCVLACVDYHEAPCGPYREVLFIPGSMRFGDGRRHLSISRIVVSTWASVVSGRANWGIPKDRADIAFERGADGDRVVVSDAGRESCVLEFSEPTAPRLPLRTRWLPNSWQTLAQRYRGQTYYYRPEATGSVRPCFLRSWRCDAARFPDLARATVLTALRVEDFAMTFPVANVSA